MSYENLNTEKLRDVIGDVYAKVSGQSDMDWSEICEAHGLGCHPDSLRKAGVGIKLAADAGMLNFQPPEISEYNDIYKGKINFYDQRRKYNEKLRREAREEYIATELVRAAQKLDGFRPLRRVNLLPRFDKYENEAVLILSDWHYGMIADNVFGKYDTAIARERVARLRDSVIEKMAVNSVSRLVVVLGGDMCAGAIHTSNRVLSTELTVDQIMHVSEIIADMIAHLSAFVTSIRVYSTFGNHSRVVANLSESVHEDNFERLIPFWLRERLKQIDNVTVEDGTCHELLGFDVNGHAVCAVHGDLDGGKDAALTLAMLYKRNFGRDMEVLITGHFHHHLAVETMGIECIQSGCLCGTDEYAKNKRLFSRPCQTLLIFSNAGIDSIHNIVLDDNQAVK